MCVCVSRFYIVRTNALYRTYCTYCTDVLYHTYCNTCMYCYSTSMHVFNCIKNAPTYCIVRTARTAPTYCIVRTATHVCTVTVQVCTYSIVSKTHCTYRIPVNLYVFRVPYRPTINYWIRPKRSVATLGKAVAAKRLVSIISEQWLGELFLSMVE